MPNTVLPVQAGNLPTGYCPLSVQDLLNNFAQVMSVNLATSSSGGGFLQESPNKPSDTTNPWLQLDSLGRPVRIYVFAQGAWLSQHPLVPGFTMLWTSALPDFTIFDGGDANALSQISGPMWEVVAAAADRFPVGVGVQMAGVAGATGGATTSLITTQNLPNTSLGLVTNIGDGHYGAFASNGATGPPISSSTPGLGISNPIGGTGGKQVITDPLGQGTPLPIVPPFYGVYLIRRTARTFYAVT